MIIQKLIMTVVVCVLFTSGLSAMNIETVSVGNPGNANDTHGNGYGGVEYEYNIGKYMVTAGQYTEFLNAVAKSDPYGLYSEGMVGDAYSAQIVRNGSDGNYTYSVVSDYANRPVNCVSWGDAARFANWLHNGQPTGGQNAFTTEIGSYTLNGAMSNEKLSAVTRAASATWVLPSEDEWYKAAYHKNDGVTGNYFDFPTSSDVWPSNDLDGSGNNATFYDGGYTIGHPYFRTEVGAHENSESPYGTFDQGGNLWEWNEAKIGSYRGLRGGSFDDGGQNMSASNCINNYPSIEGPGVGFRIAYVPEPITLALYALGSLALVRRRKIQS